MATGDAAPAPLSIAPPPIEPLSDDDGSSPLSDVQDKDGDTEDFADLKHATNEHQDREDSSGDDLSDANDTEAETERLYDTPKNPTRHKDVPLTQSAESVVHVHTPSKLRHQDTASGLGDDDDDESLSDHDISMASSPPAQSVEQPEKLSDPTLDLLAEAANREAENRKRKRSSIPANVDEKEPLRKRTESAPATGLEDADGDTAMAEEEEDDDELSVHDTSGEHSADEGHNNARVEDVPEPQDAEEAPETEPANLDIPTKKQTRSGSRRQKDAGDAAAEDEDGAGEAQDGPGTDTNGAPTGDEQGPEDIDEEAEAAHRNEEELERKRLAFEQLTSIEKRFTEFRDRLYEERIEQLNREEAMLRSSTPIHPEYLSMMQAVDARRDERIRRANRELEFRIESLQRLAVGKRAQIHSQYFQSVRESRERVLAELGQHWYDIQHERRKQANNVPEFGIRYPPKSEHVANALAYNKEVSILSGVAKYEGMPAAPDMRGASIQEIEDDFDVINRNKRPFAQQPSLRGSSYADYSGLPFGQGLGPAGEQFLEQTPWANPHHPSNTHFLQRQPQTQQETGNKTTASSSKNGQRSPFMNHMSPPTQNGGTNGNSNGHSKGQRGAPRPQSHSPEAVRAASFLEQSSARGLKTAAAAAAAAAEASVKRETGLPVGGI